MAKVLNKSKFPIILTAKDGNTCQIPVGESKIQDKFCTNVPPLVKVLSLDIPIIVKEVSVKKTKKGGNK